MKQTVKVIDVVEGRSECPFPLEVIPNHMGINLVSVDSVSWNKTEDDELVDLTIHFIPTNTPVIDRTFIKNLQAAACFNANSITPSLFQLIGQRQIVAKDLLKLSNDSERYTSINELYTYLNNQIKEIMGL